MAERDCDVVHCPTVGNKHWMFDTRLADVVNRFALVIPFGGTRHSILTIIGWMRWAGKNGRAISDQVTFRASCCKYY